MTCRTVLAKGPLALLGRLEYAHSQVTAHDEGARQVVMSNL